MSLTKAIAAIRRHPKEISTYEVSPLYYCGWWCVSVDVYTNCKIILCGVREDSSGLHFVGLCEKG